MRKYVLLLLLPALALGGCTGLPQQGDQPRLFSGFEASAADEALAKNAYMAERQDNFAQAAQIYGQILENHPDNDNVALAMADAYRRAGDNDRAIAQYDGLLAKDPDQADAKEGKSLALMAKGDLDTPARLLAEVMKQDGKRWKTLNALGVLFTTRNLYPEGQLYFQAALKYRPDSPAVLNNIGLAQALARHPDEALATLVRASSAAAPDSQDRKRIDLNRALVYATIGKTDEAAAITGHYYSGAELDNNLGLYAHIDRDDQLARAYLSMALTESKTYYETAWNNLRDLDSSRPNAQSGPYMRLESVTTAESAPVQKVAAKNYVTASLDTPPENTVVPLLNSDELKTEAVQEEQVQPEPVAKAPVAENPAPAPRPRHPKAAMDGITRIVNASGTRNDDSHPKASSDDDIARIVGASDGDRNPNTTTDDDITRIVTAADGQKPAPTAQADDIDRIVGATGDSN